MGFPFRDVGSPDSRDSTSQSRFFSSEMVLKSPETTQKRSEQRRRSLFGLLMNRLFKTLVIGETKFYHAPKSVYKPTKMVYFCIVTSNK